MIVLMLAAGCGSPQPTPQQACERYAQVCKAKDDLGQCTQNLTELKGEVETEAYGKMLSCASGANTCGEWVGCALGGIGADADPEAKRQIDGLRKGLRNMADEQSSDDSSRDTNPRDTTARDEEAPLPPECARIDELCDPDETLVRDECRKMVRNIRSDTASLGKLAACFAPAKNCYALDKCLDELWFELH